MSDDVAVHEAGHAVSAALLGSPVWAVTIRENDDYAGRCLYTGRDVEQAHDIFEGDDEARVVALAETVAVVSLMGYAATNQFRLDGWRIPNDTSLDEKTIDLMADELASRGLGSPAPWVEHFVSKARTLANRPVFQDSVRTVADRLEAEGIMVGAQIQRIIAEVEERHAPTSLRKVKLGRLKQASRDLLPEIERLQEHLPPPPRPVLRIVERS